MGNIYVLGDEGIERLLHTSLVGRIACASRETESDPRPYLVPLAYGYDGESIYTFSNPGRKIEIMRSQPSSSRTARSRIPTRRVEPFVTELHVISVWATRHVPRAPFVQNPQPRRAARAGIPGGDNLSSSSPERLTLAAKGCITSHKDSKSRARRWCIRLDVASERTMCASVCEPWVLLNRSIRCIRRIINP